MLKEQKGIVCRRSWLNVFGAHLDSPDSLDWIHDWMHALHLICKCAPCSCSIPIQSRGDVRWALGVLLFELVTGHALIAQNLTDSTINQTAKDELVTWHGLPLVCA